MPAILVILSLTYRLQKSQTCLIAQVSWKTRFTSFWREYCRLNRIRLSIEQKHMGSYRSTNFNQRLRNFTSVIETVLNNPLSGNALLSLDAPYFIIYTLSNARRSQLSRADCCHSRQWVRYPISQFLLGRAILSPVWYMLNSLLIVPQIVQSLITF